MPIINIRGTIINFPNSGSAPNWAPAVIQFAEAVEAAILLSVGPFDVSPQTQNIDAFDTGTADITNLLFPPNEVRSATVTITTHRTNSVPSVEYDEVSTIDIVYNGLASAGSKWEISRERTGDALITFAISDIGQMSFTTSTTGSGTHLGTLSFSAKALERT